MEKSQEQKSINSCGIPQKRHFWCRAIDPNFDPIRRWYNVLPWGKPPEQELLTLLHKQNGTNSEKQY